ncbi:MAG TPA: 3-dehydroquinate synthase II [Thermoplasmata archaeon]|nr:3-dehydroquinate synthase II [Thermoplasmata archaeon]
MTHERVTVALTGADGRARAETLERARRRGFTSFAVRSMDRLRPRPDESWLRIRSHGFDRVAEPGPSRTVAVRTVRTPDDLSGALRVARRSGSIAIRWAGARVIPLESALAERPTDASIWVVVRELKELSAALGALETGADRVIVEAADPGAVEALERALEEPGRVRLAWTTARVTEVRPAGLSERVLVDTTSLLGASEGLFVGSSAALLFHVASEALGSSFSRPRPFRVNAGSPHLYVLMADGTTRYLSELEAGDLVLAAAPGSPGRAVRVGRLKIERRPMVLVGVTFRGRSATVFLQEAETVRLSGIRGPTPVTALPVGTRVRAISLPPARHLGRLVRESIEER